MRILLCVVWCYVWWYSSTHSWRRMGVRVTNSIKQQTNFEEKWFVQKLDHFNSTNTMTWNQRYFVNQSYYKRNGPVIIAIEGEILLMEQLMVYSIYKNYSMELNGIFFYLEHRIYGLKPITPDLSTENLKYASIEQALADTAKFIAGIRIEYDIPNTSKCIVFGISYSASLAAWMRLKYPHLVHIAVAADSVIALKVDYSGYWTRCLSVLAQHSNECKSQLIEANFMFNHLVKSDEGAKTITKKFNLCDPLDKNNKKDVIMTISNLLETITSIIQFYWDYGISIDDFCNIMVNKSMENVLDRFATVFLKIAEDKNMACYDSKYNKLMNIFTNTSAIGRHIDRIYEYQLCTELGMQRPNDHLFHNGVTLEFLSDMCAYSFGKSFNMQLMSKGVERTNMRFGAFDIRATRVIYIRGSNDVYNLLQNTHKIIKNTEMIKIEGGYHSDFLWKASSNEHLIHAQNRALEIIRKWLAQDD